MFYFIKSQNFENPQLLNFNNWGFQNPDFIILLELVIIYTFIDNPTFCLSKSIFITLTFTMSPTDTISDGFFMNFSLISEI